MRRRLALATLVGLLVPMAEPAAAHTVDRFTACVATSATTPTCDRRGATLDAGATAFLRGRVSPAHPGRAQVWRRTGPSERFVRVGTATVSEQGRLRWSWTTDADDVAAAPHTFQFRLPGHGRSWTTKVRVRRPRPPTVRLCAAVSSTDPGCHASVTYEAGRTVFLRGRVRPNAAVRVDVLHRRPRQVRLARVDTVTAGADGRIRWTWRTRDRDIDGGAPHLLALRLPTGERSKLVEIWVVPRHDP